MLKFGLQNLKFRKLTFFFYGIVSTLTVPSRLVQDNSSLKLIVTSILLGILITVIILPLLWLICTINQRLELGKRSIYLPLILLTFAGAIRGLILHSIIASSGLEDNLDLGPAIFSSTLFTLIYFITISSFVEAVLQKREKFSALFMEASILLANPSVDLKRRVIPGEIYNTTLAEIKKSVLPFGLQRDHISSEVLLNASGEIQKQINEVLRPLSHRLWVNGLGRIKHRNLLGLLKDAVSNLDFSVKHILFYQFFVGGYGISLVLGLKSAIFVSSIGVCTSILLIRAFYFLRPKANKNLFPLGLGFLILIGLLPVFIPIAIRNPLSESASALAGLLISPTIPGLILLVSSYRLISRDRDFAIGAASSVGFRISSLNKGLISESSGIELAQYFHNSLQSELYGISKQLESSSKNMKNENARGILDSLDRALSRKYDEISSDNFDAVKRIDNLIDSWKGIAEILIAGTETIANNLILAHTTSQILEEMITNAIRYGQADKIEITLEIENLELLIILKHNGNGEISKKSGLGTLLLAQYSESGLTIETKNGYTYLRLNVPAGEVGSSDHS